MLVQVDNRLFVHRGGSDIEEIKKDIVDVEYSNDTIDTIAKIVFRHGKNGKFLAVREIRETMGYSLIDAVMLYSLARKYYTRMDD